MLKECLEGVTFPRNCKDAMVACEQKDKLTLDQDGKDIGPLCGIHVTDAKGSTCKGLCQIHDKDAKGSMCTTETEDCSLVQVHALVVDDMFVDRKIVERLVKSACFNVTAVDSGAKALAALSGNNNINLILTDYCMPEMSGYDLLKHVKDSPTLKDIPVVIMSSENVPDRIQRCLEEGAEEFLLKPVRLADVKRLRSYVFPPRENSVEQKNLLCKKRKFNTDGFQVQSPERTPRLGRVTVA